jgi:hypothetical protein
MLRSRTGQCRLTIAAGIFAAGARALALDASDVLVYSFGPVRVRPHVTVSGMYDDNIFFQGNKSLPGVSAEADFITVVSPAVNLQLGRTLGNHILLSYEMDQTFYARNNAQDHRDHLLSLHTRLQGNRLSLEGSDSVQFLSGILGGSLVQTNTQNARVDRLAFLNHYRLEYDLTEKIGAYVDGTHDATDYEEGTTLYDANTLRGTGGFAFRIAPKIRVFGEGYYGQSAVNPNRPFNTNDLSSVKGPHLDVLGGFVGASGDFHPKLTGSVKVGYETRRFSNSSAEAASPVVDASLTGRINDKTTAVVGYARRSSVSVQAAGQSYASDIVSAGLDRVLSSDGKLLARLGGSFENATYEDFGTYGGRNDKAYRANFALIYNIQLWLSTSVAYDFEKYVSNDPTIIDYDVNRVSVRVSVGY